MWDDPAYAREAGRKIQRYIANGVFPAINLIITSETADHPLAMDTIEKTLDMYF